MRFYGIREKMEEKGITLGMLAEGTRIPLPELIKVREGEEAQVSVEERERLENLLELESFDVTPNGTENIIRESPVYLARKSDYTLEDYDALPDDVRAELIDGQFFVMDAPFLEHQVVSGALYFAMQQYIREKKGTCFVLTAPVGVQIDCDEKTVVQPDILIICDRKKMIKRGIIGAPDLIVEILSESTRKKDMGIKLRKYRDAGVREYWMVDIRHRQVIVYYFEKDENPIIYGFEVKVPVGIYDGELEIDFEEIKERLELISD
ncbi:Uma2 family endonuclease [Roseburia hominis]